MVDGIANSLFRFDKKDIPVFYDENTEKITFYFDDEGVAIPDNMDVVIVKRLGLLTDGVVLYKLSVPLFNTCAIIDGNTLVNVAQGIQHSDVDYYIRDYKPGSKYNEMHLQFAELNSFLPSISRANNEEKQIVFFKGKDQIYNFEIDFKGKKIDVSFDVRTKATSTYQTTAETFSELTLKFPETSDIDSLIELYIRTRNFFAFVCNRQNIALRDAILIGSYMGKGIDEEKRIIDKEYRTQQKICFNQKYLEPLENAKNSKKVLNIGYFASKLKELFQLFFEKEGEEEALVNSGSIHHSFKYRNLIDLEHSLHITATFEYYVRTILPEMSSASTIEFIEDMKELLDEYISSTSGKKKAKAKSFRKGLKPQISLEEKILKAYNGYGDWASLSEVLLEWFGVDVSDLADAANEWRNELAHEKREYCPDVKAIRAIRLVEHLNYCIILRKAGYSNEEIKNIIQEILAR